MRSRSVLPSGPQLVLGAALVVVLCACAGKQTASDAPPPPKVALEEAAKAAEANDLRKYVDDMDPIGRLDDEAKTQVVMEPPPNSGAKSSIAVVPTPAVAAPLPPPRVSADLPGAEAAAAVPDESPESRLGRLVGELRQTIRELRAGGDNASAEAIELLGLDMLQADSVEPELRAVEAKLPGQQRTLATLRQLLVDLRAGGGSAVGLDARRVAGLLSAHADRLADSRAVRITGSALCTSVESFGRYTRFPSYTFLQGRAQPLIIYVAVENFSQRPAAAAPTPDAPSESAAVGVKNAGTARAGAAETADDGDWVVELSETVAIHTESDDLVVWRAPDASIRDVSRDRRRDYYLVQRIELPPRLTLGKYTLKISVRDGTNGATDEAIIPIEIVADAALVKRR